FATRRTQLLPKLQPLRVELLRPRKLNTSVTKKQESLKMPTLVILKSNQTLR
ncbi:hypothetical protein H0H81_005482, partial [Sphagnurus paluster]